MSGTNEPPNNCSYPNPPQFNEYGRGGSGSGSAFSNAQSNTETLLERIAIATEAQLKDRPGAPEEHNPRIKAASVNELLIELTSRNGIRARTAYYPDEIFVELSIEREEDVCFP